MVGCRHGAKNTLVKNYLWFAERKGARILPERQAVEIRPLGAPDGSDGYAVVTTHPGAWLRRRQLTLKARGVVVAAGPLGTNRLLAECKHSGALPRLSERLGHLVRTNSESIQAVTAPDDRRDFSPLGRDHLEHLSRPRHPHRGGHLRRAPATRSAACSRLMTGRGTRLTRPLKWIGAMLAPSAAHHPPSLAGPVVATHGDPARHAVARHGDAPAARARRVWGAGCGFRPSRTRSGPTRPSSPPPSRRRAGSPSAPAACRRAGSPSRSLNIPTTAHILGGAVIGADAQSGVVDSRNRVFGYENLLVCDGAAMPANPGVNPSLTITALAEHAMSNVLRGETLTPRRPPVRPSAARRPRTQLTTFHQASM